MSATSDVLIVGAGIAGASAAISWARRHPELNIDLVFKGQMDESNTWYAQGGIAAIIEEHHEKFESHINDTLIAGAKRNDIEAVRHIVSHAPEAVEFLLSCGVTFDVNPETLTFDYGLEGGHSEPRILHVADHTGRAILQDLIATAKNYENIHVRPGYAAKKLIIENDVCTGVEFVDIHEQSHSVFASKVILATGGYSRAFAHTTNPSAASGAGQSLCLDAGIALRDMHFIQFHPTFFYATDGTGFLLTEALRGAGAVLLDSSFQRFMHKYDDRLELAPRDIVSRAIYSTMMEQHIAHVWLDARHLDEEYFDRHFPTIRKACQAHGIEPLKEFIPVVPAAHYAIGGIPTDIHGQTAIKNLLAIGECASTGLHGANRLASNSLLEAVVVGIQTVDDSIVPCEQHTTLPLSPLFPNTHSPVVAKIHEIHKRCWGIVLETSRLSQGMNELIELKNSISLNSNNFMEIEAHQLLETSIEIYRQALEQKHNEGCYFNRDYTS